MALKAVYVIPGLGRVEKGTPFELGGIKYPANWLEFATPSELKSVGIVKKMEPEVK